MHDVKIICSFLFQVVLEYFTLWNVLVFGTTLMRPQSLFAVWAPTGEHQNHDNGNKKIIKSSVNDFKTINRIKSPFGIDCLAAINVRAQCDIARTEAC